MIYVQKNIGKCPMIMLALQARSHFSVQFCCEKDLTTWQLWMFLHSCRATNDSLVSGSHTTWYTYVGVVVLQCSLNQLPDLYQHLQLLSTSDQCWALFYFWYVGKMDFICWICAFFFGECSRSIPSCLSAYLSSAPGWLLSLLFPWPKSKPKYTTFLPYVAHCNNMAWSWGYLDIELILWQIKLIGQIFPSFCSTTHCCITSVTFIVIHRMYNRVV